MLQRFFLILFCAFLLSEAGSCKKIDQDPDYNFTIVVKTLSDSTRIQNALVEVYVPRTVSTLEKVGFTNIAGEASFEYEQDAVFQVRASRGKKVTGNTITYTFIGCTYVRLEPNQEVFQTVYIEPYDPELEGCAL